MMTTTQKFILELYYDWCNNFLTFEAFTEHHGMSKELAAAVIRQGRKLHNQLTGIKA